MNEIKSKKYVVVLELDVRDGSHPRKWMWDDLIDTYGTEVIVKRVEVLEKEDSLG